MTLTLVQVLKEKKELSIKLKKEYKLPLKNKAFGLILIKNKILLQKLYFGLANLEIDFVIVGDFGKDSIDENYKNIFIANKVENYNIKAFDFAILDNNSTSISEYNKNAVVPISPINNHFSSILKEYQPMKNEGNSYLYENENEWSIFHAITRYLENYKITFDNKNLLKNIYIR